MNFTLYNLFSFVKTLTDEEMIDVQKYTTLSETFVWDLTTIVRNCKGFNESALLSSIASANINCSTRVITTTYNTILQALNNKRVDPLHELLDMHRSIRVLFEKKQFEICTKLVIELKRLAVEVEAFHMVNEAIRWEKMLALYNVGSAYSTKDLIVENIELCNKISNVWAYRALNLKTIEWEGSIIVRSDRVKKLRYLLQNPLLKSQDSALSKSAKSLRHAICASIHRTLEEYEEAQIHYKELMELYNSSVSMVERKWGAYLATVNNYANISLFLRRYDDALLVSDTLKQLYRIYNFVGENHLHADLQVRAHFIDIQAYKEMVQLDKAIALIPTIEKYTFQTDSPVKTMYKIGIIYEMGEVMFLAGAFEKSVYYLKILDQYNHLDIGSDSKLMGLIILLLAYSELQQYDKLEEGILSIQQYIKSQKIRSRYEPLFIDLMKSILKCDGDAAALKKVYCEYKMWFAAIHPYIEDETYFNISAWLESKIRGISLADLLKQRYEETLIKDNEAKALLLKSA